MLRKTFCSLVSHMTFSHVCMYIAFFAAYDEYEASKYSPKLLKQSEIKDEVRVAFGIEHVIVCVLQVEFVDFEEDVSRRDNERRRILAGDKVVM